jgi:RNA polymerase sigma-70 factor, ECF subfamily
MLQPYLYDPPTAANVTRTWWSRLPGTTGHSGEMATTADWLTDRFEENRPRLRAVAYRMLGSLDEADDAVQDAWIRVQRAGDDGVENLGGWLTTIVGRVCLNKLRSRNAQHETSLDAMPLPDPVLTAIDDETQPETAAVVADSVGIALQVVLDTLEPAERLAFVLHDVFGLPFDDIAPIVERTPAAARQLASRARRRVKGADARVPERDVKKQREVVDAFFAAARGHDLAGLIAVLDPAVVLRADFGRGRPAQVFRGVGEVTARAKSIPGAELIPVLVNGTAGVVAVVQGRPFAILGFTVSAGKIVEIDGFAGHERVTRLVAEFLPA